jgi:hypothetical protein
MLGPVMTLSMAEANVDMQSFSLAKGIDLTKFEKKPE